MSPFLGLVGLPVEETLEPVLVEAGGAVGTVGIALARESRTALISLAVRVLEVSLIPIRIRSS